MTQDELIELLNAHEWRDVEFKEEQRDVPQDAYETVSAFADTEGGRCTGHKNAFQDSRSRQEVCLGRTPDQAPRSDGSS